jgi:hypothetical protein
MEFDSCPFFEDGPIDYLSTVNQDTAMVGAPTAWPAAMEFDLQDIRGAGKESRSQERARMDWLMDRKLKLSIPAYSPNFLMTQTGLVPKQPFRAR